ncbi:MAG: PLP-dependent aminotransferase family protein [Anaerolineae bacterium]|nr:PLP-dependent aminotransferase family protein [Anaerolineae bacterium]
MNWNSQFATRTQYAKRSAVRELLKLTAQPDMISFAGGLPAPELFPVEKVKEAADLVLSEFGPQALQYGETEGIAPLRDWVAAKFSRAGRLTVRRENVLIVSGAQQGLDLIGRVLLNEGDPVIVENPTYLALLGAWRPLGVRFVGVPSDQNGMVVDALEPLLQQGAKMIYSIPTFQNPQGTTLSLERRLRLAELLRKYGIGLLEDNPYGELRYSGEALPHVFELDAQSDADGRLRSHVIYSGTFSKVLTPGLRIGWVVADEAVIDKLVMFKQGTDLHTSTLNQYVTYTLARDGVIEQQLPRLQAAYCQRRDIMLAALARHFPAGVTWTQPDGGLFLMVTLPAHLNAADVLQAAIAQKVAFVPGEDFHLTGGQNTFRLNFSNAQPERIERGIEILGQVLNQLS